MARRRAAWSAHLERAERHLQAEQQGRGWEEVRSGDGRRAGGGGAAAEFTTTASLRAAERV